MLLAALTLRPLRFGDYLTMIAHDLPSWLDVGQVADAWLIVADMPKRLGSR